MSSKRTFILLLAGLAVGLVALFAATYEAQGLIASQANKLRDQRLQIQTLDAEATALTSAKRDIKKYQDLADIAKSIVPQDKDQALTVREIVSIAAKQGIAIGSVTFPSSSLGGGVGGTTTNPNQSQLLPVAGIPGVYYLQITVQSNGSQTVPYNKFISFLDALEHNRRTALVSSIALTPDSKNSNNVGFNLTLDEYIKP
jgi:hypothetical protein